MALLSKLDRVKNGQQSFCSIVKNDNRHPKYSQTMDSITITALEDKDYYTDREAGKMHPEDEEILKEQLNEE